MYIYALSRNHNHNPSECLVIKREWYAYVCMKQARGYHIAVPTFEHENIF
jgi:hypothetical protein